MASLSHGLAVGGRFIAVAVAALPVVAKAEHEAPGVSYEVALECPSATWFEGRLDAQLQGRERPLGEIDVRATHGEGFVGVVAFRPAMEGAAFRRELEGKDCEEVLSGLALGLALHWDTLQTSAEGQAPAEEQTQRNGQAIEETTATTRGTVETVPVSTLPTTSAAPTTETQVALSEAPVDDFDGPLESDAAPRWPFSVTAGPGWRSGTSPNLDAYGALNIEVFGTGEGLSSGAYGLRLETTLTSRAQGAVSDESTQWESRWFLVAARGCPFGKRAFRELTTSLCASLSAGNYRAHIDGSAEVQGAIARLGFGPRVSLQLGHFHALVGGAWEVPLLPVQVTFAGRPVHHQQAGFTLQLEAGFATEALE